MVPADLSLSVYMDGGRYNSTVSGWTDVSPTATEDCLRLYVEVGGRFLFVSHRVNHWSYCLVSTQEKRAVPPKNWRWFHQFAGDFVDLHAFTILQKEGFRPAIPRKVREPLPLMQRLRQRRKIYKQRLYA